MSRPTQRERMVAGELYESWDPELIDGRGRARQLTARFNATPQEREEQRLALMRELFAEVGAGAWIEPPFQCDYGWNISLGERAFVNFNCVILDCAPVSIGALTKLGPAVQLCTATHPIDPDERASGREYARPITIGTNVWVGSSVIVGPGVTIHDECVIGAGSVVLNDVPARVVAAGAPCRVLRTI